MSRSSLRNDDSRAVETAWKVRKIVVQSEQILSEAGAPVDGAVRVAAAAVIANGLLGTPVTADLQMPVRRIAPRLAKLLTDRILDVVGGAERIEAFGKGAIVGIDGEMEHGAALIHTPYYASLLRHFLQGDTVIPFADDRSDAGALLTIPLGRKGAGPTRDHFQTVAVRVPDAPRPDEIVVVAAASTGTRPFPRSGDRTTEPAISVFQLEGVFE